MTVGSLSVEQMNVRHGIVGVAEIATGSGDLPMVKVRTLTAAAEIYLHGAQVTSWRPAGYDDVIFLSEQSAFQSGKAIRGGIPICFPWFRGKADDPKAPSHGFVRTRAWELAEIARAGQDVTVTMATGSDAASRLWWPHEVRVMHRITVGAVLKLELTVSNTGTTAFHFEEALHTYHGVGDATQARVAGLDGTVFQDNVDGNREKVQSGDVTMVGPTDNAYLETRNALELIDPVLGRRIRIEKENSSTTVVWNPWTEGAKALPDLGDHEWQQMVCVEACNIRGAAVTLAPGASHTMAATISVRTV